MNAILSAENGRADVVKEGGKFIEKITQDTQKRFAKFVNVLSLNF